tara:strand:- start:3 stop:788 length:786 start_codon:yes stop_codon:yes gene_type:complete
MKFQKKSLGQNFLVDKNIVDKILNLTNIRNKDIIEIGPGRGALTDEILKKKPNSLLLIEKDIELASYLTKKFSKNSKIKIINTDFLKFKLEKIKKKNLVILGNLPYNISSQILIKVLKTSKIESKYSDIIFMFQKELGEKTIGKFTSKSYGRLSIITNFKLYLVKKFLVSSNCFFPKPKVTSIVLHFKTLQKVNYKIKNITNLEKITNILFSQKRKMIKKNINKILDNNALKKIKGLDLNLRPEEIRPEIYYKITELYEKD